MDLLIYCKEGGAFFVEIHYHHPRAAVKLGDAMANVLNTPFVVICIGTDRCIGDSLGPLIGHQLSKNNFPYPVYGTLEHPIHAINLIQKYKEVKERYPKTPLVAIDASLGKYKSVGNIQFRRGSIAPGKGVGKVLPAVGDFSLVGIVDTYYQPEELTIHQVRLHLIHQMAQVTVDSLLWTANKVAQRNSSVSLHEILK